MANRTLSYHEVTRPTLETRLARLRDCRSHGEQGLDGEIQTLCQALTAIETLSAENARLREALMALRDHLANCLDDGDLDTAEELHRQADSALAKGGV